MIDYFTAIVSMQLRSLERFYIRYEELILCHSHNHPLLMKDIVSIEYELLLFIF